MASGDTRYCPYLGEDLELEAFSVEHILPVALGGTDALTIQVSKRSNSRLGSELDARVSADFFVATMRVEHGTRGRSGREPDFSVAASTDLGGEQRRARLNVRMPQWEAEIIPSVTRVPIEGREGEEISVVSGTEEEFLTAIANINRKLVNKGWPTIEPEMALAASKRRTVETPSLGFPVTVDTWLFKRFWAKLALGLGHLHFGERFSRCPAAQILRAYMWSKKPADAPDSTHLGSSWPSPDAIWAPWMKRLAGDGRHILGFMNLSPRIVFFALLFGQVHGTVYLQHGVDGVECAESLGAFGVAHVIDITANEHNYIPLEMEHVLPLAKKLGEAAALARR